MKECSLLKMLAASVLEQRAPLVCQHFSVLQFEPNSLAESVASVESLEVRPDESRWHFSTAQEHHSVVIQFLVYHKSSGNKSETKIPQEHSQQTPGMQALVYGAFHQTAATSEKYQQ